MSERFPNFRRAKREHGPYYRGPATVAPFKRKTSFRLVLAGVVGLGTAIGWFWR